MQIAYILFDNVTLLDLAGIYDPVSRLRTLGFVPDLKWDLCAMDETIMDGYHLAINVDKVAPALSGYDMIIVPGGLGTRSMMRDRQFMQWLRSAAGVRWKVSVCTGSLLLGAAGFLEGRRATTHFEQYDTLQPFCKEVVRERIVEDFDVITAGAVASSLDLGLYLCEKLAGPKAREAVRQRMDYRAEQ
ncbi:MAG: DJ-1/PfpI family protein [Saprospiraceae bacterium]|nr:DJ-1/PfpI family protein [Saprospiraceae bacterium]